MSRELAVAVYRLKDEVEGAEHRLLELLARHPEVLAQEGLITDRPVTLMRSAEEPVYVEIFEWVSAQAAKRAHDNHQVMAVWQPMAEVAEFVGLSALPEADKPFAHFEPVDL